MSELNINGMTTIDDVLVSIKEAIESGDRASAIDQIQELRTYLDEYAFEAGGAPLTQEDIDQYAKYGDWN